MGTLKTLSHLPLVSGLLDGGHIAQIFIQLDLYTAYHVIWINEANELKTTFQTHYGQLEYRVIPFWLIHTSVPCEAEIDDYPQPDIEVSAVCYHAHILIYWTDE